MLATCTCMLMFLVSSPYIFLRYLLRKLAHVFLYQFYSQDKLPCVGDRTRYEVLFELLTGGVKWRKIVNQSESIVVQTKTTLNYCGPLSEKRLKMKRVCN